MAAAAAGVTDRDGKATWTTPSSPLTMPCERISRASRDFRLFLTANFSGALFLAVAVSLNCRVFGWGSERPGC